MPQVIGLLGHRVICSLAKSFVVSLVVLYSFCLTGCGSSQGSANSANVASDPKPAADTKRSKPEEKSGKSGQKSIDGIPYDVFFDKPLVIAANNQTGAPPKSADGTTAEVASTTKMSPPADSNPAGSNPAESAGAAQMIDKEPLLTEIKNVRNYLAGKTSSPATYNSSFLEIPPEAATLAVLAAAAGKLPDDLSWKKNAKHIRDLSAKIAELTSSKDAKTKNTFDQISDSFTKIDEILKGSPPADLAEADDEKDYGDVIGGSVVQLMKRIKKSEETLKANVSSEAGLKKEAERVAQEGALLAFLADIIQTPGFGFGGDAEFTAAAKPLREGGKQLIEAAKSGNYSSYDEAMSRIGKSCSECHNKFKP